MHHLSCGSFETAEILLDLGASPSANSTFDLVRASLIEGGLSFLKRLLRYSTETGTIVQWNGIDTYFLEVDESSEEIEVVTYLHHIASNGLNDILDFYIDEGLLEDINITTAEGHTAVHLAAITGQAAAIHRLHAQGASLALQSRDESTALHLAVRNKNPSVVKVLLELGAKSSLDARAITPRMYASALNDENMIKLLDRHLPFDVQSSSVVDANFISRKRMKYLAQSFENAIVKDDLKECKRLYHVGCSLGTSMSSCHGCSPLIEAIRWERLHIVDWLLECKATTLKVACQHHQGLSAVECAIECISLNPILKRLLSLFIEEGGDVFSDGYCPLKWAIISHNEEGLRLFLGFVKDMAERIG